MQLVNSRFKVEKNTIIFKFNCTFDFFVWERRDGRGEGEGTRKSGVGRSEEVIKSFRENTKELKLLKFLENFYAPPSTRRPLAASLLHAPKKIQKQIQKQRKITTGIFYGIGVFGRRSIFSSCPIFVSFCVVLFFLSSRSIEK